MSKKNDVSFENKTSFWGTLKKEFFGSSKFNPRSETYKLTLTAIIIACSVGFSLIEVHGIYTPWGEEFDYRILDTLFLFIAIRITGLAYAMFAALVIPWLHLLIDGAHSPISMIGFSVTDILCILVFWVFYYHVFKAGLTKTCPPTEGEDGLENHHHKYAKSNWLRKILALIVITILCAIIESAVQIAVYEFLVAGIFQPKEDDVKPEDFYGIKVFALFLFFIGVFSIKYIIEEAIFIGLEKPLAILSEHYGVF